jgi:hypothetical protein
MNDCYAKSKNIITKNKKLIETMSKELLKKEYLTKNEFILLMNNKKLPDIKLSQKKIETKKSKTSTKKKTIKKATKTNK